MNRRKPMEISIRAASNGYIVQKDRDDGEVVEYVTNDIDNVCDIVKEIFTADYKISDFKAEDFKTAGGGTLVMAQEMAREAGFTLEENALKNYLGDTAIITGDHLKSIWEVLGISGQKDSYNLIVSDSLRSLGYEFKIHPDAHGGVWVKKSWLENKNNNLEITPPILLVFEPDDNLSMTKHISASDALSMLNDVGRDRVSLNSILDKSTESIRVIDGVLRLPK